MRIGIVSPPWVPVPPTGYGGTEAVIDRLARGLVAAGHDVLLWCTGDSTCPVPRGHVVAEADGEHMGFDAIELHHVIRGYEALLEWGAEIVHDHTLIGPVYSRRFTRLPVVTTNHGPFNAVLSDLYRVIADDVGVIAISHDQAARTVVPIAAVIHHGLDVDRFPVGDGTGDAEGPYLAYLGRMAPEKGARRAALAAGRVGARLIIAAKMQDRAEHRFFHDEVEPLLDDRITFIGEIGPDERVALLGGATALLNPIAWPEPFGLAMIEALACGTPVVALRAGSAAELIDDGVTGLLCDDMEQLVRRLGEVAHIDRRRCREEAERRFTTERMVADHVAVYERIVRERQGSAA
ncbi:MAG TPA: glycosyltransferase [Acidimicrobiales bacterium]|nr:glycosyltransferase [Acidimicrobiales bacterium]